MCCHCWCDYFVYYILVEKRTCTFPARDSAWSRTRTRLLLCVRGPWEKRGGWCGTCFAGFYCKLKTVQYITIQWLQLRDAASWMRIYFLLLQKWKWKFFCELFLLVCIIFLFQMVSASFLTRWCWYTSFLTWLDILLGEPPNRLAMGGCWDVRLCLFLLVAFIIHQQILNFAYGFVWFVLHVLVVFPVGPLTHAADGRDCVPSSRCYCFHVLLAFVCFFFYRFKEQFSCFSVCFWFCCCWLDPVQNYVTVYKRFWIVLHLLLWLQILFIKIVRIWRLVANWNSVVG